MAFSVLLNENGLQKFFGLLIISETLIYTERSLHPYQRTVVYIM